MNWNFYTKVLLLSCALSNPITAVGDADKQLLLSTTFSGSVMADKGLAQAGVAALNRLSSTGDEVAREALQKGQANVHQQKAAIQYYQNNQRAVQANVQVFQQKEEELKKREEAVQQLEVQVSAEKKKLQGLNHQQIMMGVQNIGANAKSLQDVLKEMIFLTYDQNTGNIPGLLTELTNTITLLNTHIAGVASDSAIPPLVNYLYFENKPFTRVILEGAVAKIVEAHKFLNDVQAKIQDLQAKGLVKNNVVKYFLDPDTGSLSQCLKIFADVQAILPNGLETDDEYARKTSHALKNLQAKLAQDPNLLEQLIGGLKIKDSASDIKSGGLLSNIGKSLFWLIVQLAEKLPAANDVQDLLALRNGLYQVAELIFSKPADSKTQDYNWGSIPVPANFDPHNEFSQKDLNNINYKTVSAELDNYEQNAILTLMKTFKSDADQVQYTQTYETSEKEASRAQEDIIKRLQIVVSQKKKFLDLFGTLMSAFKEVKKRGAPVIRPKSFVKEQALITVLNTHAMQNAQGLTLGEATARMIQSLNDNTAEGVNGLFTAFDKQLEIGDQTIPMLPPPFQNALGNTFMTEVGQAFMAYGKDKSQVLKTKSSYDLVKKIMVARGAHVTFLKKLEKLNQYIQFIDEAMQGEKRQSVQQNQIFLKNLLTQYVTQQDNYLTLSADDRMTHFFHTLFVLSLDEGWDVGLKTVQLKQDLLEAHNAYIAVRDAIVNIRPFTPQNVVQPSGNGLFLPGFEINLGVAMLGAGGLPPAVNPGGGPPPPIPAMGPGPAPKLDPGMDENGNSLPDRAANGNLMTAAQLLRQERDVWEGFFLKVADHIDNDPSLAKDTKKAELWEKVLTAWIQAVAQNMQSLKHPPLILNDLKGIANAQMGHNPMP